MKPSLDHAAFVACLAESLPEVAAEIDEYRSGLLNMEMATIAASTSAAAESGDWATVRRHLEFVEQVYQAANEDVKDAVHVAYMEHLPLWGDEGDPPELRALLPDGLAGVLRDMEGHEFGWSQV